MDNRGHYREILKTQEIIRLFIVTKLNFKRLQFLCFIFLYKNKDEIKFNKWAVDFISLFLSDVCVPRTGMIIKPEGWTGRATSPCWNVPSEIEHTFQISILQERSS